MNSVKQRGSSIGALLLGSISLCVMFATTAVRSQDTGSLPAINSLLLMDDSGLPPAPLPATLNDTGITFGIDYPIGTNQTCTSNIVAPQDCHQGRDVTDNDDSDGHAGFSFTKLDASGTPLVNQGEDYVTNPWSCVKDNVTGLIWEVKTDDNGIHDKDNTFRWGGVTSEGDGSYGVHYGDWDSLVNGSNTGNGLCGLKNWRVPRVNELVGIVNYGARLLPALEHNYFPNTPSAYAWSATPTAVRIDNAWIVGISGNFGRTYDFARNYADASVRLVSSGK